MANVIHITGRGKMLKELEKIGKGYYATEMMTEDLPDAFAAADIVIARAGMGTIGEIVALRKPCILVPLPHSPQEKNAAELYIRGAGVVFEQSGSTSDGFFSTILSLLEDEDRQKELSERVGDLFDTDVHERIIERMKEIAR